MVDFTTLDQNAALSGQHLLKMQTTDACWTRVMNKYVATIGHGRDVRMGRGGGRALQYLQICKKVGQKLAKQQEGLQQYVL